MEDYHKKLRDDLLFWSFNTTPKHRRQLIESFLEHLPLDELDAIPTVLESVKLKKKRNRIVHNQDIGKAQPVSPVLGLDVPPPSPKPSTRTFVSESFSSNRQIKCPEPDLTKGRKKKLNDAFSGDGNIIPIPVVGEPKRIPRTVTYSGNPDLYSCGPNAGKAPDPDYFGSTSPPTPTGPNSKLKGCKSNNAVHSRKPDFIGSVPRAGTESTSALPHKLKNSTCNSNVVFYTGKSPGTSGSPSPSTPIGRPYSKHKRCNGTGYASASPSPSTKSYNSNECGPTGRSRGASGRKQFLCTKTPPKPRQEIHQKLKPILPASTLVAMKLEKQCKNINLLFEYLM